MTSFTREDLQAQAGRTVPDLVGPDVRLLFVGINPGLWTAATQTHFAHPGNRFHPALHLAGIIGREIDPREGWTDEDRAHLTSRGIAITNLVERASARADDLTTDELASGAERVAEKVSSWRPAVVCVVGITAYRSAFGRRGATAGRQPAQHRIGDAELFVLGNPSGLNAHETVESLARAYRDAAEAARVPLDPPRW